MNKENMLLAAKWIREDGLVINGERVGFNMAEWWIGSDDYNDQSVKPEACTTVACLAGTISLREQGPYGNNMAGFSAKWLGLDEEKTRSTLFVPLIPWEDRFGLIVAAETDILDDGRTIVALSSIPAELVARVLEDMATREDSTPNWAGVIDKMTAEAKAPS